MFNKITDSGVSVITVNSAVDTMEAEPDETQIQPQGNLTLGKAREFQK